MATFMIACQKAKFASRDFNSPDTYAVSIENNTIWKVSNSKNVVSKMIKFKHTAISHATEASGLDSFIITSDGLQLVVLLSNRPGNDNMEWLKFLSGNKEIQFKGKAEGALSASVGGRGGTRTSTSSASGSGSGSKRDISLGSKGHTPAMDRRAPEALEYRRMDSGGSGDTHSSTAGGNKRQRDPEFDQQFADPEYGSREEQRQRLSGPAGDDYWSHTEAHLDRKSVV